jgi:hypothetical protein
MKEMYLFFAIVIQMGHDYRDCLKDYWIRVEQYFAPFDSNTMVRDRFFHILRFLHFENNVNPPNRDDPHYDRLWKIRNVIDTLDVNFTNYIIHQNIWQLMELLFSSKKG